MAHNHEVAGSSPAPATMKKQQIEIRVDASLFLFDNPVKLVPVLFGIFAVLYPIPHKPLAG